VDACVVPATGTCEREAAVSLVASRPARRITAHATRRTLDRPTTRHPGYALSQRVRKRIEEVFCWMKTVGGMRKLRHRGGEWVNWQFLFNAAAYNMVRMRSLTAIA
jgi:hypothetical protein